MRALQHEGLSQRHACRLVNCPRSNMHYRLKARIDEPFTARLRELAAERPRFGWRRLQILLRREGMSVGEHRLLRTYRECALQVRPRKKRKVRYIRGNVVPPVTRPNERWSIDFMHDRLVAGRTLRTMNVVDDFTRECVVLEVAFSFGSHDVIRFLEDAAFDRGLPKTIRFDNGSEFTSRAMLRWGAERDVNLHFIDPGKPTQNAQIESLNGRIRDELLNAHSFVTIFEVRRRALAWKEDYNNVRPHSSLDYRTPREFAALFELNQSSQPSAA